VLGSPAGASGSTGIRKRWLYGAVDFTEPGNTSHEPGVGAASKDPPCVHVEHQSDATGRTAPLDDRLRAGGTAVVDTAPLLVIRPGTCTGL
jgi:hypothetical protein